MIIWLSSVQKESFSLKFSDLVSCYHLAGWLECLWCPSVKSKTWTITDKMLYYPCLRFRDNGCSLSPRLQQGVTIGTSHDLLRATEKELCLRAQPSVTWKFSRWMLYMLEVWLSFFSVLFLHLEVRPRYHFFSGQMTGKLIFINIVWGRVTRASCDEIARTAVNQLIRLGLMKAWSGTGRS